MLARSRLNHNKKLPPYLYGTVAKGGKTYYSYRNPKTGKLHGMGTDEKAAVKAALQLNAQFMSEPEKRLIGRVLGGNRPFSELVERCSQSEHEQDLSKVTTRQREWQRKVLLNRFGSMAVADITTQQIADFLAERPPRMANVFRSTLVALFNRAMADGWIEKNPAAITQPRKHKVKRERLSLDQFEAIVALAEPHIQTAMRLSLLTLQRREDIHALQWSHIQDGCWYLTQQKTRNKLRIALAPPVQALLERSRVKGAKYVIVRLENCKGALRGERPHIDGITKGFARARDVSGLFDDWDADKKPTFHEIRSLGARLYEKRGIDPQALLGHRSRKMTDHYLDSRGSDWTDAAADLNLA